MHATYFPQEGDYKIFSDNHKFIAEGFNSKEAANEFIAKKN